MTLKPSSPPDALAEALTAYQYNDVTGAVAVNLTEALLAIATAIDRIATVQDRLLAVQERIAAVHETSAARSAQTAEMMMAMMDGHRGHA